MAKCLRVAIVLGCLISGYVGLSLVTRVWLPPDKKEAGQQQKIRMTHPLSGLSDTLSPKAQHLLAELPITQQATIEAFVSTEVPDRYVRTREDVLTALQRLERFLGSKVRVRIHHIKAESDETDVAKSTYKISPRHCKAEHKIVGLTIDEVFLNAIVDGPLERVSLSFCDRKFSAEYELVSALYRVSDRFKTVGLVLNDANPFLPRERDPVFNPDWPILNELAKHFSLVPHYPGHPSQAKVDALLVLQPSSLGPKAMEDFIAELRSGLPTAIFEDPFVWFAASVPSTEQPRRPRSPIEEPLFIDGPAKGNINRLWPLLGIEFSGHSVVCQKYCPCPLPDALPSEFVFVDVDCGTTHAFSRDRHRHASSGVLPCTTGRHRL